MVDGKRRWTGRIH